MLLVCCAEKPGSNAKLRPAAAAFGPVSPPVSPHCCVMAWLNCRLGLTEWHVGMIDWPTERIDLIG